MRVKNLNGTSKNTCSCGSWLKHWEKFSGQPACQCYAIGCLNSASVGALVQKDDAFDRGWYVVPLCAECNAKRGGELEIWKGAGLVSADVSETCGRQRRATS